MRSCIWTQLREFVAARPATRGGAVGQLPPLKFSQAYVFVRDSNKLHHFAPPQKKYQLVAAMMLHCSDPTHLRVEPATSSASALSTDSNRDLLLSQLHPTIAAMNSAYMIALPQISCL